jgi:membrane-bound lytic murein transglycosylase D
LCSASPGAIPRRRRRHGEAAVERRAGTGSRGTRKRNTQLRPYARLALLTVVALAGCAAPEPRKESTEGASGPPAEAAIAAADAEAREPRIVAEPIAKVRAPSPFPPLVEAELEPLPPPAADIWDRIVKGYAIPDIEGPLVEKWERFYADRPDYVARAVDRSRRYLYHIVNELDQRGMPLDIALLPMVESAFNPRAHSVARAAGIWQFIPSTGKQYGLDQNFWVDSRRDVIAATDGALDYLQRLYGMFGDWQLALAAYNWGEGNVTRAAAKNRARGRPADYLALDMPDETRNYLPKLQAVKNIVRDPERYGLVLADVPDAPYFAVVRIGRKMDVKKAAELAELAESEFLALNPQHNRPVIAGADEFTILLPIDNAELFAAKLDLHDQPLVSWQAYHVKDGDSLPQIAAKFGLSVETLRAVNGLGSRARIHGGHLLLVPAERPSDAADASLTRAVFTVVPQGRTFYHTVRRGETLGTIAARYRVSTAELREWNGMSQSAVRVGQQIRVTSDVVASTAPRGRSTRNTRSAATGGAKSIRAPAKATGPRSKGAEATAPGKPASSLKAADPGRVDPRAAGTPAPQARPRTGINPGASVPSSR